MRRLVWVLLLALLVPSLAAAQDGFRPGTYRALPRDSTTLNRFRDVEFEFQSNGVLLWRRGGTVVNRMRWRGSSEMFEIDEAVGCDIAPTGLYRIVRWVEGFAFEPVRDGCTMRVAALNTIYLLPKGDLAAGRD